jgi:putative ABC transport system permease protein
VYQVKEAKEMFIIGLDTKYAKTFFEEKGYSIIEGRVLKEGDKYKAMVGYNFYEGIGGLPKVSVNDKIEIAGKDFRVVGTIEKMRSKFFDSAVYIPLDIMRKMYGMDDKVGIIYVKVKEGYDVDEMAEKIREKLRKYRKEKRGKETFEVTTARQLMQASSQILTIIQIVLVGIAAISLLVGGIGIMNTMYTSMLERTKEIGIMKAIGARKSDIMCIFLIESGLIGVIGGVIGVALGLVLAKLVEYGAYIYFGSSPIQASFNPLLIIGAIAFSFFIGLISGVLPAMNAANLDPVEALRYE